MVALVKSLCFSFIVLASIVTLFAVADAHKFNVGGDGAWVINRHESYISWAKKNRFQVNDTLYFKFAKGSDSLQEVTKADYDGCNVNSPIEKFDNGDVEVTLNRTGVFYFISGIKEHCSQGQKLIIAVLGIRNQPEVPISPAKAPSTAHPPKSHSPVAPAKAPSTAQPPKSHSPVSPVAPAKAPSTAESPKAHSPVSPISPAKPPSKTQPPKAHSPVSPPQHSAPSPATTHSPSVSPSKGPTTSPSKHSPPSKSPSPSPSSPKISPRSPPSPKSPSPPTPSASPPPKPPTSPPSSPTPSESTPPADNNMAPAPSPKSAATVGTVTSVMSTLLGVAFTVLMFA